MHCTAGMLTIVLTVGIAVGIIRNQALTAQQGSATRTILQQKDLEGVAGKEVIMYRAEPVPGGRPGDTRTLGLNWPVSWKAR